MASKGLFQPQLLYDSMIFCIHQYIFHCRSLFLINFPQADPHCKWAILNVMNEDVPVSDAFPHFLADSHHEVRILAAKSITR